MCYKGLALKSLLKVRLRCKACHASQLRIRSSAKSIAACKCTYRKKLRGGLRGAKWGWRLKAPTSPHPIKIGCIRCDYFLRYFSNGSLKLIIRDIIMGSSRILQEFNKKKSMIFLLKSHCGLFIIDPDNI